MAAVTVWTKQDARVLDALREHGVYRARREHIAAGLGEQAALMREAYDWLVRHGPDAARRPEGAYPVWVSFSEETVMLPEPGTVRLTLEVDESELTRINIAKWGAILNYAYLPADEADGARHRALLAAYRTSDAQAYMSQFYPTIKREIVDSWARLFDERVQLGSDACYGNLWEIRRAWVRA